MKKWRGSMRTIANWLTNCLFYACQLLLFSVLLQVFCVTSFKIPSDSMEPSLMAGDRIVVNKLSLGARLFNVFAALEEKAVAIHRMPGVGQIDRNDVLVFNFPYKEHWDSICFDVMKYYVKRCIALPGDTLEIRKGRFKVRGVEQILGNPDAQARIAILPDSSGTGIVMHTFPRDERLNWTIKEFGPLPIPAKGQVVAMNYTAWLLYRQLIGLEQNRRLRFRDGKVMLGDSVIHQYQFKGNYYFVSGDKMENSKDSRYWGMLPESYIVGKAVRVWKSNNPSTGAIRWERIWKRIE